MKTHQPGDIYKVALYSGIGYFQHVANDKTQLGSNVIRVFVTRYGMDERPTLEGIAHGDTDFFAHVSIPLGVKLGTWVRIGTAAVDYGATDLLFAISEDFGDPDIETSRRWGVWRCNAPIEWIGPLTAEHKRANLGYVINPMSIVHKMATGRFDHAYQGFEDLMSSLNSSK
mgnify:CR=1 FL=1